MTILLGTPFSQQHELFLSQSRALPSLPPPLREDEACVFGSTCHRDILSLVFKSFSPRGLTLVQYKTIAAVCRHWKAVLQDTAVFLVLQSVQRHPAFAFINPAVNTALLDTKYAHYFPKSSFFRTSADAFFEENPKVRIRVPQQDIWLLDVARVQKWNRKFTRIFLPDTLEISMRETILSFYPVYIKRTLATARDLCSANLLSPGALVPIIYSDTDLLDNPSLLREFCKLFDSGTAPHPRPSEWHVVVTALDPFAPRSLRRAQRNVFFPPAHPVGSTDVLLRNEIEPVRAITIRGARKVHLYVYPSGFVSHRPASFCQRCFDGFFLGLMERGLLPQFADLRELHVHMVAYRRYSTRDAASVTCLRQQFSDRTNAWTGIEKLRTVVPELETVRYFLTFEHADSWYTIGHLYEKSIALGVQSWDRVARDFTYTFKS